jgi:hypothetical protein
MRFSNFSRAGVIALTALVGVSIASVAHAGSGTIRLSMIKGGWVIGVSGGNGSLSFRDQRYPLSVAGLSIGLLFGASQTILSGRVSHIRQPSEAAGVYVAAGGGVAIGAGARAIVLTNEMGAVMRLEGREVGLLANTDLSGLVISMK